MANQIVVSAGAKVRNLSGVLTATSGVVSFLPIDVSLGIPQLDVNGKILVSQLPNSVMEYKGTWDASTNTPTLANGTGNQGDVYLCNVAGTVNFGAGPIAFVVGDQVIYSGSIWQRASGATGTVTSVAITESGDSLNITGSPITTSGTINIGFNGTNLQYVNGAGNLTTFPTLITSIGLSMPSAFSVANSPLTANGTIAVTGAGVASQYIRGDGTLADFPSSGGGGSSVSYYLNGGTSQGTISGTTYYEMSKTAVIGTGVDFTKTGDGFIVAFLTDANDPAQLNIPAGNWNYEIYASMSANGGTPEMYAELYKYDGTTFTLIATSPHEILYDGTALNLYTFAMTVPATTLALTDRLAIKLYATNSGGKTTTIHTQDSHLCQIITTFSTGITALNGLTAQVQYFQTGTSGTDFNISSTTATHTFNIPDASATARGLITTGTQTIAGTKTFSDATKNNGGIFLQNASSSSLAGYMNLGGLTNGVKFTSGGGVSNTFTLPSATGYTFTFPNATGTIALTSDISYPVTSVFGRTGAVVATSGDYTTTQVTEGTNLYYTDVRARAALSFVAGSGAYNSTTGVITIPTNNNQITNGAGYTTNVGTVTSVAATGGTGISITGSPITTSGTITITNTAPDQTVALTASTGISVTGTYPNFTITNTSPSSGGTVTSVAALTIGTTGTDLSSSVANSTTTPVITLNVPTASATNRGALSSADWTTFNGKQAAINGTGFVKASGTTISYDNSTYLTTSSAASTYVPYSGATSNVSLGAFWINTNFGYFTHGSTGQDWLTRTNNTTGNYEIVDWSSTVARVSLTASGNLGLGVTPSAWTSWKALQINGNAVLAGYVNNTILGNNWYYDGTDRYTSNGFANIYQQGGGIHAWYNAPSGTAGAAITFTQAMTLTAAGRLLINKTNEETYQLDVNGTGRFITSVTIGAGSSQANIYLNRSATTSVENAIRWQTNGTSDWYLGSAASGANSDLELYNYGISAVNLKLSRSTGAATFSSSVTIQGGNALFVNNAANTRSGSFYTSVDGTEISSFNGAGEPLLLKSPVGYISMFTNGSERMRITSGGDIRITSGGTTNAATLELTSDATPSNGSLIAVSYLGSGSYGPLRFGTGGSERMRITSGGVLQVANGSGTLGTIVGSERLNVNGDVFAYGSLYVNTNIISYGTITTGPTGYGAGAFKIGPLQTGTASSAAGCIPIVIDGTLRYINVFNAI